MPRGNGLAVKLLIAQRTGEVPPPGWHLPACPALVLPVAALGDVQNFMGSPPFKETDKMPGVALNKPSFLILQSLLLSVSGHSIGLCSL